MKQQQMLIKGTVLLKSISHDISLLHISNDSDRWKIRDKRWNLYSKLIIMTIFNESEYCKFLENFFLHNWGKIMS